MDIKNDFKLFRDKHDPWGESLNLLFEIAAELWWRGECPGAWEYSPGMAQDPRDPEAHYALLIAQESTADLTTFGHVLNRHVQLMAHLGHSY